MWLPQRCLQNVTQCMYTSLTLIGTKLWRVGSRKVFAVKRSDLVSRKRHSDSSDEEGSTSNSSVTASVKAIQRRIDSLFEVDKSLAMPMAMRRHLLETFRCHICRESMKPPIIFTKCCKYILGCQSCVNTWYGGGEGLDKPCPRCRTERAFGKTCQLKGMDEFLKMVGSLDESADDDSQ